MYKKYIKIITAMVLSSYVLFIGFEPSIVSAVTDEVLVTQTVTSDISMSSPSDASMSRDLTTTALTATGAVTWNVKTNAVGGYNLKINASNNATSTCRAGTNPLKGGSLCSLSASKAFYDVATTTPAVWSSARVAGDYSFGFSAFGTDVDNAVYASSGQTVCDTGSANVINTTLKYRGFEGTNQFTIANKTSETAQAGVNTTLCLATDQGTTVFAPSATYIATTTATAVTN